MRGIEIDQAYPDIFSSSDAHLLASMQGAPLSFETRRRVVRANEPVYQSVYLCRGFAGRYRADKLGRRQIVAIQIPGDFVDLPSFALGHLDHDVETLSAVTAGALPHEMIAELRLAAPLLYDKLWRISLIDAAIHRYWVFRVGRLVGRARVANFFAELLVRLFARRLCGMDGFDMPINQSELGEACGMTAVHANRMIGELRAEGICSFTGSELRNHDIAGLVATGQFDWDYLFLPDRTAAVLAEITGKLPRPPLKGDEDWVGEKSMP